MNDKQQVLQQDNIEGIDKQKGDERLFDCNSAAVTTSLLIKGEVINRLAYNSNVCKTLAVTLAGAIVSLASNFNLGILIFISAVLVILGLLDALYIGMKKQQEDISKEIIENSKSMPTNNPYETAIKEGGGKCNAILRGLKSISVPPFYIIIIGGLALYYYFKIHSA